MKKVLSIFAVTASVLVMASCGGKATTDSTEVSVDSTTTVPADSTASGTVTETTTETTVVETK